MKVNSSKITLFMAITASRGVASGTLDYLFHIGYQGYVFPRRIRKFLARSKLHKA